MRDDKINFKKEDDMTEYKLIAFDMDGTLLNAKKEISPANLKAIQAAAKAGKDVAISTGRPLAEMRPYMDKLSDVRWLVSCSGAYVFDLFKDECIYEKTLDPHLVIKCMEIAGKEEAFDGMPMINMHTRDSFSQRDQQSHMKDYGMGPYQGLYDEVTTKIEDIQSFYKENPFPIGKINFYHKSPESRERSLQRFKEAEMDSHIEMVYAEVSSLECSPKGLNKAVGIEAICNSLGISIAQAIAVGDADNDLSMLNAAGLAVAMGNANENVMKIADVIVNDNNHDGCADAIYKYML